MRGADRSSNARIVVKYIDRVSIGMEINRQRISPYGKCIHCNARTQTHIENVGVVPLGVLRERECESEREIAYGRKGNIFACHGSRT